MRAGVEDVYEQEEQRFWLLMPARLRPLILADRVRATAARAEAVRVVITGSLAIGRSPRLPRDKAVGTVRVRAAQPPQTKRFRPTAALVSILELVRRWR